MKAKRKRDRAAGLCLVCGQNPASASKTVCDGCNEAAKVRVAGSRAKAKKPKRKATAKKKAAKAKR